MGHIYGRMCNYSPSEESDRTWLKGKSFTLVYFVVSVLLPCLPV